MMRTRVDEAGMGEMKQAAPNPALNAGRKDDSGKIRYSLVPPRALALVARVLTYGAERYGAHNWERVENGRERYTDAVMRHVEAWRSGEKSDPDTGVHHLAHAVCCALFLVELETR